LLTHFPAKLSPFPIKYLGISLSVGKLRKSDLQPLVDKVADALPIWKAKFLTKAARPSEGQVVCYSCAYSNGGYTLALGDQVYRYTP